MSFRTSLRALGRQPGFALAVVLTLALGIGANTAIFSVVHGVLLRPLPYRDGDDIVLLQQQRPRLGVTNQGFSALEIADYGTRTPALAGVVEHHSMWFILLGGAEPERVQTSVVSHNYFDVMGIAPLHGRAFRAGDDAPGADAVLILSHDYWLRRFGGDSSVVGRVFEMNDRPHTVVGVMKPLPEFPAATDVYMPVSACPFRSAPATATNRNARLVRAFARMKAGTSVAEAQRDLDVVAKQLQQSYPEAYPESAGYGVAVTPLRAALTDGFRPTLILLLASAGFVLLIVCASVANLILARTVRQERELAVRSALGASRARLAAHLLSDTLVVSVLGAVLGLALAWMASGALVRFTARFTTRSGDIRLDWPVLAFTVILALLTAVVTALIPALTMRRDLIPSLQEGSRGATGGRVWFRNGLIVAQVAVSFALVVAAGLMVRSLTALQRVDTGVKAENVMTFRLALNFTQYIDNQAQANFYERLLERLKGEPGVTRAAIAGTFPLNADGAGTVGVRVEGVDPPDPARLPRVDFHAMSPDYFELLGVPLLRGRSFAMSDTRAAPNVAIVNQVFVNNLLGNAEPIGRRISFNNGQTWNTIVGVVADTRQRLDREASAAVYRPLLQSGLLTTRVLVQTATNPQPMVSQLRAAVHSVDNRQPVDQFRTLEEVRAEFLASPRLTVALIGIFAVIALVITSTGLAGVIGYSVSQRAREFGIRMALGESRRSVVSSVILRGLLLVGIGLLLGVAGAFGLSRLVSSLLFNVTATDPMTFIVVAVMMAAVGLAACALPARRAASIDPIRALRAN